MPCPACLQAGGSKHDSPECALGSKLCFLFLSVESDNTLSNLEILCTTDSSCPMHALGVLELRVQQRRVLCPFQSKSPDPQVTH